jgi:hypothetical protein
LDDTGKSFVQRAAEPGINQNTDSLPCVRYRKCLQHFLSTKVVVPHFRWTLAVLGKLSLEPLRTQQYESQRIGSSHSRLGILYLAVGRRIYCAWPVNRLSTASAKMPRSKSRVR